MANEQRPVGTSQIALVAAQQGRESAVAHAAMLFDTWKAADKAACTTVPAMLRAEGFHAEARRLAECDPPAEDRAAKRVMDALDAARAAIRARRSAPELYAAVLDAREALYYLCDLEGESTSTQAEFAATSRACSKAVEDAVAEQAKALAENAAEAAL